MRRGKFQAACSLGLNSAVAYLVLARFSARNNRITTASVQAIEKHSGISRGRARATVKTLIAAEVVKQTRGGIRPRYDLGERAPESEWIWLPNALVTGAAGEVAPVERVRQTQDVMMLRLLIELYCAQNLLEDGGISRRVTWTEWKRHRVGEQAQYDVWGFAPGERFVCWAQSLTDCHKKVGKLARGENAGSDFFRREKHLTALGLIQWVPYLYEGDGADAEPIHPYGIGGTTELEDRLGLAAHEAGEALITDGQRAWAEERGLWLAPVPRHIANVQMIGVARLRYRPHTTLTAAWWADLEKKAAIYIDVYKNLVVSQEPAATVVRAASM